MATIYEKGIIEKNGIIYGIKGTDLGQHEIQDKEHILFMTTLTAVPLRTKK